MKWISIAFRPQYIVQIVLVAIVFALYLPVLHSDYVSYDDHYLVRDNVQVQAFDPSILWTYDPELYVPLTLFTYQIDHSVFGGSAVAVHVTNVLLHCSTILLLFLLLRRFSYSRFLSSLGAFIFAAHPLQVGSVAWASGRKELLFTLFFLASVLLYTKKDSWKSKTSFVLSLSSKVTAVTLPIVLLLVDWKQRHDLNGRSVLSKWFYFLFSVIFGVIAYFGKSSDAVLSWWETLLLACRSILFYLEKFFVPTGLTVLHPLTESIHITRVDYALPVLICILLCGGAFVFRKKFPDIVFGFLFFLVTLSPSFLGYAKAGQIHLASEHYMYLPIVGLIILVLCLHTYVARRYVRVYQGIVFAWIALLICVSFNRIGDWKNSETLYRRVLSVYPESYVAANNLGAVHLEEHRVDDALSYVQKALSWNNRYDDAYVNLSEILRRKGDFSDAQKASLKALELNPDNAQFYTEHSEQSTAISQDIAALLIELEVSPENPDLWWKLGSLYGQKELYKEGIQAFYKAASLDPSRAEQAGELRRILEQLK